MRIFRPVIVLTVLTVGLIVGSGGATVQPPLLVVIIFLLLHQQFRKRDFYVVEHFVYDLNFTESTGIYGKANIGVERGPMFAPGCRSVAFLDYAAAKASFDYQEDSHAGDPMSGTECIHRVYVVSASRKPANALLKDDKYRTPLLHKSTHQIMYSRRKEAREDRLLGIENDRAMAKMRAEMSAPTDPET